jgi:SAM-dependent methyltransferase
MVAADGAFNAVRMAAQNSGSRAIFFAVSDAHSLPFRNDSFDLVLVQSVLHHDYNPLHLLREAFRIAPRILIHEPNGNNIGLKLIERISRYHIEHGDKSYGSRRMKHCIEAEGGLVVYSKAVGFVPMFCPDWIARATKFAEPAVEWTPLFCWAACAVYVMVGIRK